MSRWLKFPLDVLGSLRLSVTLLLLLLLLTYFGTLHQVEHGLFVSQKLYFDSWFVMQPVGPGFVVPLPGGLLVMSVLFANLLVGGLLRLRFTRRRLGVIVTHVGIAFLLVSGFVKFAYAEEGAMQLFEGQRAAEYHSYYDWEVVVAEPLGAGRTREYTIPQARLEEAASEDAVRFTHPELPFELELAGFAPNARPLPKGPMFSVDVPVIDGYFLQEQQRLVEAERNIAGCYATLRGTDGDVLERGILWGGSMGPWVAQVDGTSWSLDLRKKRMSIPFSVRLDETARELHPGTSKPRAFRSDVTMIDGALAQPVRIQMNEPLRHAGFVLYQSGWGPDDARPGDRLFSVFAVVRNPADRWPLYACIVIAAGLLLQFSQSLLRHIRSELRPAS